MGHHVAKLPFRCPRCAVQGERTYVATTRASGLRVSESVRCAGCSYALEADGSSLTADARAAFLAADGTWVARVRDLGVRKSAAFHTLRVLNALPIAELWKAIRTARPLCKGARVEVEQFADVLRAAGADVAIARK